MANRRKVVVYGGGGQGKVVADLIQLNPTLNLLGFLDDAKPVGPGPLGFNFLGGGDWLQTEAGKGVEVVFGISHNQTRARIHQRIANMGARILTVIHPSAAVAVSASLAPGVIVMANATINSDARIGAAAIINTGSVVEHDCIVGDYAQLGSNSAMGGASEIGMGVLLGLGATVLPTIKVGARTIVGAGAAVVKDLPEDCIAVGVPAKVTQTVTKRP